MGLNSKLLPDSFRKCIAKEERAKSPELQTQQDASDKHAFENEREMHETFTNWCRVNDLNLIHSTFGRKATIESGWPDFTILKGKQVCCVEFKHGDGRLKPDQIEVCDRLLKHGVPVLCTQSVIEAIAWTKEQLGL